MSAAVAARPISVAAILSLLRELATASRAREYSRERYLYTTLLDMEARLPSWLVPAHVEPATEIHRSLDDGAAYELTVEGDLVRLEMHDVTGDDTMHHLDAEKVETLIDDLRRVMAAQRESA